jgi:WD40 repeat protein
MSHRQSLLLCSAVIVLIVVGVWMWTFVTRAAEATVAFSLSLPVNDRVDHGKSAPVAFDLSEDTQLLVAATQNGAACVWRLTDDGPRVLATLPPARPATDKSSLATLCLSSAAPRVAMAFDVATKGQPRAGKSWLRLWDFEKQSSRTLATFDDSFSTIAITPRGDIIAVAGTPHHPLRVVDGDTGRILWTDAKMEYMIDPLAFSPQGSLFAVGVDRGVRVYEARTGRVRRECAGSSGTMLRVAFTDDGSRVCAGGVDSRIYVWDLANPRGDLVFSLKMPSGMDPDYSQVTELALSRDSTTLFAFAPRDERPDFWERLQNPPVPGIVRTQTKGSLIFRCPLAPGGTSKLLVDMKHVFSRVRLARDGHSFAALKFDDSTFAVWHY